MNQAHWVGIAIVPWLGMWANGAIAATPDHVKRLLQTNQCPMCDLSGADLQEANLFGANLVNANLRGANLTGANLGSANLTDADLTGATLTRTYLHRATLENTNFSQATLSGAYLRDAVLRDTRLDGANLQGINLSRANLIGISLKGVDLTNANLSHATFSGVRSTTSNVETQSLLGLLAFGTFQGEAACVGADRQDLAQMKQYGISFEFADLSGSKLRGANLQNALLPSTNLSGADFTGANLTEANLVCSNLKNAILDGADLKNARLNRAILEGTSLKDVKNASIDGTFKSEAELKAAPIQTEAKQYVGSMNRSQQAYFLEYNRFAAKFEDLGLGIKPETKNYSYRIFLYREPKKAVMLAGVPKKSGLKSYVGFVTTAKLPQTGEETSFAVLCESDESKPLLPKMPATFPTTGAASCPTGFMDISRERTVNDRPPP